VIDESAEGSKSDSWMILYELANLLIG